MNTKRFVSWDAKGCGVTRRTFLGAGVAGGAALIAHQFEPFGNLYAAAARAEGPWIEATIPQLQALMNSRRLTSRELTRAYLQRIAELNPLLGAVIETNPQAMALVARLDVERRRGIIRGPLHGIPILVKDNIATDDHMETTAGSLALVRSRVPDDAPIVKKLRAAGGFRLAAVARVHSSLVQSLFSWTAEAEVGRSTVSLRPDKKGLGVNRDG